MLVREAAGRGGRGQPRIPWCSAPGGRGSGLEGPGRAGRRAGGSCPHRRTESGAAAGRPQPPTLAGQLRRSFFSSPRPSSPRPLRSSGASRPEAAARSAVSAGGRSCAEKGTKRVRGTGGVRRIGLRSPNLHNGGWRRVGDSGVSCRLTSARSAAAARSPQGKSCPFLLYSSGGACFGAPVSLGSGHRRHSHSVRFSAHPSGHTQTARPWVPAVGKPSAAEGTLRPG